jgi:hypothetical protein
LEHPVALADTDRARTMVVEQPAISVRDAFHAAVILNHDITEVATFDEGLRSNRRCHANPSVLSASRRNGPPLAGCGDV